ncbi:MAG: NAD(P)/FAD-dependent oxidoreductase [Sulfobacillus acidophilus]|uniref:Ferredoxin--NADP reductase n=1 Tax=Sulfobacillus acidophilus TaxID=53633 RepID=A0A2T2WCZ9_9FIRM|nr:MAG: NAD(P)/FAD-dependent oxidoreductase [Sulfobacillus acidophilus]
MAETADVTIIGGGPVGLFGLYCAGLNCLNARLLERLDQVGGQLEHLYPEKPIYDVGGFPHITGRELVARLKEQAFQYSSEVLTGVTAHTLDSTSDIHRIHTNRGVFETRVVIITAGIGEFIPRRMMNPAIDQFEGRGLYYVVNRLSDFNNCRVLVVGGGDSAADWAMAIADRAQHVSVIHRRSTFQCHEDSLRKLENNPRVSLMPNRVLRAVGGDDRVREAWLQDAAGDPLAVPLEVDAIIIAIGLLPGTGIFSQWGLDMDGNEIRVTSSMRTNRPGIFAAGDIATYPGKVKLIAAGFGEVATAVEAAQSYLSDRFRG